MTWRTWLVVGGIIVVTLLAIAAAVFFLPQQLARPLDQAVVEQLTEEAQQLEAEDRRLQSQNAVRTSLLQAIGGFVLALGLAATWVTVLINRQGQITERFTRAVDQLGDSSSVDVRLGGIYGLQRIAKESGPDRSAVAEVLAAYVRGHSPSSSSGDNDPDWWGGSPLVKPSNGVDPVQQRAPDVHAAMLAVVEMNQVVDRPLDLSSAYLVGIRLVRADLTVAKLTRANLAGANLTWANLAWADLAEVNLAGANFAEADLTGADLTLANLTGANLTQADLAGAKLTEADLTQADLTWANLTWANLAGANLTWANLAGADLAEANLAGADLAGADLAGADLAGADLAEADLRQADLIGANLTEADLTEANLRQAQLARADLTGARANSETTWPSSLEDADQRRSRGVVEERGGRAKPKESA